MSAVANRRLRLAYPAASYLALLMVVTRSLIVQNDDWILRLFATILAVLVTMACVYDAAVRRCPWAFGVRFPFLAVWPLSMPLYVVRSRGWWGCVLLLIHVSVLLAILVVYGVIVVVTQIAGR